MMNKLAASLLALTTIGCASENDGALHLSGRLADPSQVTHLIATNPSSGERIVVDMKSDGEADGRFNVALPAGDAWIVTFADASQTGPAMRVATLQTGGIDAFQSKSGGSIDFGTVKFSGRYAHGTMTWEQLVTGLGYDSTTLKQMAKVDDLALRYSNPDVDSNGKIDALEGRDFRLELSGSYRMALAGNDLTIRDLVRGVKRADIRYTGTTIAASVPSEMNMMMGTGTVQFQQPFYGTALGPQTQMVAPGVRIGQPHVKFGQLEGNPLVGVVASPTHDAPSGNYHFGFENGKMTFTSVFAPSVSLLSAATDYAVPFVRIRPTNEQCTIDCDIASIDLEWKRQTAQGWETVAEPRDAHIEVIADFNGKRTNLAADITDGSTSLTWSAMPTAGTGMLRNELAYISTAEICYFAVSYKSELGMKMTNTVENPACF